VSRAYAQGGNSMGIVSSIIYPAKQGPHYIMGHSINLASSGIAMTLAAVLMVDNIRKNRKRDAICYANPDGSDFDYRRATEPVSCHPARHIADNTRRRRLAGVCRTCPTRRSWVSVKTTPHSASVCKERRGVHCIGSDEEVNPWHLMWPLVNLTL
jgi:hypothetical protein